MKRIEEIINTASEPIKKILLEEAEKFDNFPETMIGITDEEYFKRRNCRLGLAVEGKIALPREGIVIHRGNHFYPDNYFVLMLPDGLYHFRASRFITSKKGEPLNEEGTYPDWKSKEERPFDYLFYGPAALNKMQDLLKKQKVFCH